MADSWYYGDVQSLIDFLGSIGLRIESDLDSEDDGTGTRWTVKITGSPASGTFTITVFAGAVSHTTTAIPLGSTAQTVQVALQTLANVGTNNAYVTSPEANVYTILLVGGLGRDAAVTSVSKTFMGGTSPAIVSSAALGNLSDEELATVVRDGQTADALIDAAIDGGIYAIPLVVGGVVPEDLPVTNRTRAYMRRVSNLLTTILLNEHRALQYVGAGEPDMMKLFSGYQKRVDDMLGKIKNGLTTLDADKSPVKGPTFLGGEMTGKVKRGRPFPRVACWPWGWGANGFWW